MKYNLSMYEIGFRYVLGVITAIPIIMLQWIYLIIIPVYFFFTALLGMCPIKAIFTSNKNSLEH